MEIVKRYAQKFLKYNSESDRDVSDAFNKGIRKVTGKFIGLINSDDQLAEGTLFAVDKTFSMTRANAIYGDTIVNDITNGLRLLKRARNPKQLKYDMPFIHQSCFIKKVYMKNMETILINIRYVWIMICWLEFSIIVIHLLIQIRCCR